MTQNAIHTKALDLQKNFNESKERHSLWNEKVKDFIAIVLDMEVKGIPKFKCKINISDPGQEFVNIILEDQKAENNPNQFRKGGMLTYMLTHRAKVLPVIVYPFVEGQVSQVESVVIGNESIEPSAITENLIREHLEKFLDAMLKWETNNFAPIGFKLKDGDISFSDEKEISK